MVANSIAKVKHRPLARGDACAACKTRKIRCPGERPSCANCAKHSRSCIYLNASPPTPADSTSPNSQSQDASLSFIFDPPTYDPGFPTFPVNTATDPPRPSPPSLSSLSMNPHYLSNDNPDQVCISTYQNAGYIQNDIFPSHVPPQAPSQASTSTYPNIDLNFAANGLPSTMTSWLHEPGGQTMPAGWEDMDWSFLDPIIDQANQPEQVDESDLSVQEQEYLLWLYFSHPDRLFGLEIHVTSFYRDLQDEDVERRPHECLILAISACALEGSHLPASRARQNKAFDRASRAVEQALNHHPDVLSRTRWAFDACRAASLLIAYLYVSGQYAAAWMMTGKAVNAAIACGLDTIPSTLYTPTYTKRKVRRTAACWAPPPSSQLELAERIYAFWSIFFIDRVGAVSQDWVPSFQLDRVITPFPRPWVEFETDHAHLGTCDERLQDLLSGKKPPCEHPTDFGRIVKSLVLMQQTSLLALPTPRAVAKGNHMVPAITHTLGRPVVDQAILEKALRVFVDALPEDLKSVKMEDGRVVVKELTATVQFLTGAAEMNLYDNDSYEGSNERALMTVRRLLGVMHILKNARVDDVSMFVIMIWTKMSRILIRESKRLTRLGDSFAAASVDAEVEFIKQALEGGSGEIGGLGQLQAGLLKGWMDGPPSDEEEDEADA